MGQRKRQEIARASMAMVLVLSAGLALAGCGALTGSRESAGTASVSPGAPVSAPAASRTQGSAGTPGPISPSADSAAVPPSGGDIAKTGQAKLVIVNKTLRLETADVKAALDKLRALAKKAGGDIANMQVSTSSDQPIYRPLAADSSGQAADPSSNPLQAYVTVRVPAATYAAFVDEAAKLGKVLYQSESSGDVTQQHVDLKARLENLKAEQERLRQLFAKARNVKEMLEVEQELARVQGEVESLQAQIDYLERQAAMATVTIELAEPKPIVRPAGIDWGVRSALTESIRAFVGTLNVLIVLLGPALAILIFAALPVFLVIRAIVHRSRRRAAAVAAATEAAGEDEAS
jgi:hypothetical protein